MRIDWATTWFLMGLCTAAWLMVAWEAKQARKYDSEVGRVCTTCFERLCEDGQKTCRECARQARAKELAAKEGNDV